MTLPIDGNRGRLILVRLSAELTTKGRGTRRRFTRKLLENIREALAATGEPFHAESHWTRVHVYSDARDAVQRLQRVPGLSSMSVVEGRCSAELDERIEGGSPGRRELLAGEATSGERAQRFTHGTNRTI